MIKRREIDFTHGPLVKNMILYALPIVGVNVLQLLFTTADLTVLGIVTKNDNAIAGNKFSFLLNVAIFAVKNVITAIFIR